MTMPCLLPVLRSLASACLLAGAGLALAGSTTPPPAPAVPAAAPAGQAQSWGVDDSAAQPAATAACTAGLKPFKARYASAGFGMELTVERTLVHNADGSWTASANASQLFFTVNESTHFRLDGTQIRPLAYRYQQTAGGKKNRDWHYDYTKNTVSNLNPQQAWTLPLQANAQDRYSYQLQMGLDLHCGGSSLREVVYGIPDKNNYDEYRFTVRGHETLDTALGRIDTIKLERVRPDNKRQDIIWLAPQWNYQMVLLRHIEQDETTDTKILSLELDGKAIRH